jgi:hypothetical protein
MSKMHNAQESMHNGQWADRKLLTINPRRGPFVETNKYVGVSSTPSIGEGQYVFQEFGLFKIRGIDEPVLIPLEIECSPLLFA